MEYILKGNEAKKERGKSYHACFRLIVEILFISKQELQNMIVIISCYREIYTNNNFLTIVIFLIKLQNHLKSSIRREWVSGVYGK